MSSHSEAIRIPVDVLDRFERMVLEKLGVPAETARLAVRSLLDASLMGVDTHGVEALDMYVTHLRAGGLDPAPEPVLLREQGGLSLWDMQDGFGLAGGRKIMVHAIKRAGEKGIYLATCRRTNHIGACGVYGKMAADEGLIGMVGQQTRAGLAPWGGKEGRIGTAPTALVAPIADSFPFYYDASFAMMTGAQVKAHIRSGTPLPEGVALDAEGNPTTDPKKAWEGQVLPIGRHKGVGLAMVFEILACVLSGNRFSAEIPSIVSHPEKTAGSSIFMLVIDPNSIMPHGEFALSMKSYVEYVESSPARDPADPPRYPGRHEGELWLDRMERGIPVCGDALARFDTIAQSLSIAFVQR